MLRKINWIILSDSLNVPPHHGGPLILHYISKKLLEFGDRVYMNLPFYEGCEKLTNDVLKTLNPKEWVLITTENDFRLHNNNFKTVRLILFTGKNMEKYRDDELIFQYGKSFTIGTKFENSLSIRPIVTNLSFWNDLGYQRSETPLVLLKKGVISKEDKIIEGKLIDEVIKMNDTREAIDFELLKLFNTHKTFITYDNNTFHSVQAALCGAISIVIPDGRLNEKEWRKSTKREYGIAYGNNKEQINFALNTINNLKKIIEDELIRSHEEISFLRETVLVNYPDHKGW
jgi:hypothetical protein